MANLGQSRRRSNPLAALHHLLNQGLAGLPVGLNRDYVAGHAAVGTISTPDLFAPGPGRLAR